MSKDANIEALSGFLGFLAGSRITVAEAAEANRLRSHLLDRLLALGAQQSFYGCKLYTGSLSPGCLACGAGTWSCAYLTRQCTADCFFCPVDASMERALPRANRVSFPSLEAYLATLRRFGFQGVSFSGGEPLLRFEEMLAWITRIKREFGSRIYLWIYTNGDLLDATKLRALHRAGLDEIRVNIAARCYALHAVKMAREAIGRVTVEIPAIPENHSVVQELLVDLQGLGLDHVNLHQLFANQANYLSLAERGYTFLPLVGTASAVFESEISALRLMLFALENRIDVPINYCSLVYRTRCDNLAHRRRAATVAKRAHDSLTEVGYLRRLSIQGPASRIREIDVALQAEGCSPSLWRLESGGSRLVLDSSLLASAALARETVEARWHEAEIFSGETAWMNLYEPVACVEPGPDLQLWVAERPVTSPVSGTGRELAQLLDSGGAAGLQGYDDPGLIPGWEAVQAAERMRRGLQTVEAVSSLLEMVAG